MGASSYRSSYSGKGSTTPNYHGKGSTTSSRSESPIRRTSKARGKSTMVEMLELLEEVERCRDVVAEKKADLDSAKKDLDHEQQQFFGMLKATVEELNNHKDDLDFDDFNIRF